jgi:hypothetical protein
MQSERQAIDQQAVRLTALAGDYRIPGFRDAYATYLESCEKGAGYAGGFLLLVGVPLALLAIGTALFGPSTVYYPTASGPSLFQYIQIYPGPIMTLGGALCTAGAALYSRRAVGPSAFFRNTYELVAPDGQVMTDKARIHYLKGDDFRIDISV